MTPRKANPALAEPKGNPQITAGEGITDKTWRDALNDISTPTKVVVMDTDAPEFEIETARLSGQIKGLMALREQFPADRIEKLPKPKWKGAWDGLRGSNCPECHGYHVLDNCIHLDYVGHANVTDRLLEVDPWWSWEPMALTEQGTPLFSDNGLWIKLTVCGVTRIGYGDGKSVKEVIGDAIRNAAMRFGVGLDLWAKIDLHAERNPGDGKASNTGGSGRNDEQRPGPRQYGAGGRVDSPVAPDIAPEVQEALDALKEVCDQCGYDQRSMGRWYAKWANKQGISATELITAKPDNIRLFAAELIAQSEGQPNRAGGVPEVNPAADAADAGGDAVAAESGAVADDAGGSPDGTDEAQSALKF